MTSSIGLTQCIKIEKNLTDFNLNCNCNLRRKMITNMFKKLYLKVAVERSMDLDASMKKVAEGMTDWSVAGGLQD